MTPPRTSSTHLESARAGGRGGQRPNQAREGLEALGVDVVDSADHQTGHTAHTRERLTPDTTPPAMGSTVSITDRNLHAPTDEQPPPRSRRRWLLPAAGAVVLLAGCAVAGVNLLGGDDAPAPAPSTAAGPTEQEIQAAKDAAWTTVQAWNDQALKVQQTNSLDGTDLASLGQENAVKAQQAWIEDGVASGTHVDGNRTLTLIGAEYHAPNEAASAPQRVKVSVCNDTSDIRILDQAGNNVRVGPDGTANFDTRVVFDYWVWDLDGKWLTDSGAPTGQTC